MLKIYTSVFCTLLFSCATKLNYLGGSFTPTETIDVYVDATAIKKNYTVVGKGYVSHNLFTSIEKVQKKAIAKAKKKGANAILFHDSYITQEGLRTYNHTKTDSIGKSMVQVSTGTVGPIISTQRDILFLKYN